MIRGDKNRLLEVLMGKSDDSWFDSDADAERDKDCFPKLFALAEKYYNSYLLVKVIQQGEKQNRLYYRPNAFVRYMKERLTST